VLEYARNDLPRSGSENKPNTLRVRYPKSGKGTESDLDLEIWRSFYALHNFQPVDLPEGVEESLMELAIRSAPGSGRSSTKGV
jgi:hypothetical protein